MVVTNLIFPTPIMDNNNMLMNATHCNYTNDINSTTSSDQCLAFRFVFYGVLIGLLNILGITGNILSVLVLQKDQHNKVAIFLLQSLALADSCVLLLSFIVLSLIYGLLPYFGYDEDSSTAIPYIIKYIHPFGYIAQCITIWITVLLAINRYIAIVKPFKAAKWCTLRSARIQVSIVIIVSTILNLPRFFQYEITTKHLCDQGVYKLFKIISETSIGQRSIFGIIYTNILYTICILFIPLIALVILNSCLIREIRFQPSKKSAKNRSPIRRQFSFTSPPLPEQDNITFIMVIIIVVFLICHTPDRIFQIIRDFLHVNQIHCMSTLFYVSSVCNLLIIVNSSSNFLIYYMLRKRFRKILLLKLCAWRQFKKYRHRPIFLESYETTSPLHIGTHSADEQL